MKTNRLASLSSALVLIGCGSSGARSPKAPAEKASAIPQAISLFPAVEASFSPPCALPPSTSTNFEICSASFLGSELQDSASAVEIAPDGSVVFGGTIVGNDFGREPTNLAAGSSTTPGGDGVVIRTDGTGKNIFSVTRLGTSVDDLDVDRRSGAIAVVGPFGVALLNPQGNQVAWSADLGVDDATTTPVQSRRVSVGRDGSVAVLANKRVSIFSPSGVKLGEFVLNVTNIADIALDSDNQTVAVTGYNQKDGGACERLQVAYLNGHGYAGELKWKNYDWTEIEAGNAALCANTRGVRVSLGRDNQLYFAGESEGGNSIYQRSPGQLRSRAPNVVSDQFNNPANAASNPITYFARFRSGGQIEAGQFLVSRLPTGLTNAIRPNSITADEDGNIYVGGVTSALIPQREDLTVGGRELGAFSGAEGFLLVVPKDLRSRKVWTSWTGEQNAGTSSVQGIGVGFGRAAVAASANGSLITKEALQPGPVGAGDAFLSTFPSFAAIMFPAPAPSPTPARTPTARPTLTPSPTPTASPSPTATASPSPTATASPSPTATASPTPRPTRTPRPTPTGTVAPSPSPTVTVSPSPTVTVSPSPTVTVSPSPTVTVSPSPTVTVSPSPTVTVSPSPTVTASPSPTVTPDPTAPLRIQAEDGVLVGAQILSLFRGFTGRGYVDFQNPSGDSVEWRFPEQAPGQAFVDIRYANGGNTDRPLDLFVNNAQLSQVSFPSTGGWNSWRTVRITAPVNAGENVVLLRAAGASGPNIDRILITPPNAGTPE